MSEHITSDFYLNFKDHIGGICAIIGTIFLHAIIGMQTPALFLDEFYYGTRAWAFITQFSNPFNYRIIYDDHPPFGWLIMGMGCALMVGIPWMIRVRIFMIIMFTFQQILLYAIGSKFFHRVVGLLAVTINGLGSGFLIYQQMAFLDNIGIVFTLGALLILPKTSNHRSFPILLSGILSGISCGIKFPFLFFLPAFPIFYILHFFPIQSRKVSLIALVKWGLGVIISIIALIGVIIFSGNWQYFVTGTLEQLNRSDPGATFSSYFRNWFAFSPVLIVATFVVPFFAIIGGMIVLMNEHRKSKQHVNKKISNEIHAINPFISHFWVYTLKVAIFAVLFILFLFRGTTIYVHYILPLLPFIALLLGLFIYYFVITGTMIFDEWQTNKQTIQRKRESLKHGKPLSFVICFLCMGIILIPYRYPALNSNLIKNQYEMLSWIDENIPKNASFVVKDFFVAELYELGAKNVQMVGFIDQASFEYDWRNIDYIISAPFDKAQFDFLSEKDGAFLNPALPYAHLIYSQMNGNEEICIYAIVI